jgi:glyceraldehyde 3-phosphate dehydrogenase
MKLGINGLGRIGKLSLWHQVERRYFAEVVVNIGREAGTSLEDIALFIEKDSVYGALHNYLHGCRAQRVIEDLDEKKGRMVINGTAVTILRRHRNPRDINWLDHGVELALDATGRFRDPTLPPDHDKGSLRGHLAAGARKVVVSAPFKIADKSSAMPDDAVTTIMGINEIDYDPTRHAIVSHASCTTTCLAFMLKPLIDSFGPKRFLSVSMATVHASTASQQVLDHLPKPGATDLRKNRSIFNNIILTSTGAAEALAQVLPEMGQIPFIAESVRIPVRYSAQMPRGYLHYTEEQNVSNDIIGLYRVAATIEGQVTHTRTARVAVDLSQLIPMEVLENIPETQVEVPITKAVVYGWYDNELGSYSNLLGDRVVTMAESMHSQ